MKSLTQGSTSLLFIYCLFTLALIQHLAAKKLFRSMKHATIDKHYTIDPYSVDATRYDVRKGTTKNDVKGVMMKLAKQDQKLIIDEIQTFKDLYATSGEENLLPYSIPNMLDVGIYERRSVIILDLVGDDFMQLIRDNTVYSPQYYETVCQCAKQLIEALKFIHKHKYVHNDVRPENIAVGVENVGAHDMNRNDVSFKGRAYLCNFGRASVHKNAREKGYISKRLKCTECDMTSPYISRQTHERDMRYPRNDMEALGYTMLRIAGSKELPWSSYSEDEMHQAKTEFFDSNQKVVEVCEQMGISDIGMINVFRNYFQLLRFKYFDFDGSETREIDYEDLSDCFVYPARQIIYFGRLNQRMVDTIHIISRDSDNANASEQYRNVRIGNTDSMPKWAMVKTPVEDETLIRTAVKVFKDLYSKSGLKNLLPHSIANMLGYGVYEGKRTIILDSLGPNFLELMRDYISDSPQHYWAVCFWATQMITALKFLHQQGYVHRDIQPKNIAAGAEDFNLNKTDVTFKGGVYLFNLGVADTYKHDNGSIKIQEPPFALPFEASPYTSRQALRGYTHYPRDDMEELGYTMLSIAAGALPWSYFSLDEIEEKNTILHSDQMVEVTCKTMGMVDMGMINVFKNYFGLLNNRYFADDDYSREINYDELSACFAYPVDALN